MSSTRTMSGAALPIQPWTARQPNEKRIDWANVRVFGPLDPPPGLFTPQEPFVIEAPDDE